MLGCFQEGSGLTPPPLRHRGVTRQVAPGAMGSADEGAGSGTLSPRPGASPRAVSLTCPCVSSSVSKPLCTGVAVPPALRQVAPHEFPRC